MPTTGSDQYHSPGHHSAGGVGGVGGVGSHYHGGSPAGERGPPPSPNGDNNGPFDWRATSRALSYDADTWTQSWSGAGADTPDPDGQSAGMDMDDDGDSVCEARTRGIRTRTFVSHSRRTHAGMSSPCNTADSTVQEPSVAETGVVRLSDETDPRVPRAMDGLLQLRHVRDSRMVRVESQVLGKGSRRTGTAAHNAQRDARTARQPPADDVLDGVYAPTVPHLPFPLASALDHMQLHERIIHHEINPDHMKGWRPPVHITPAFYRAIMAASQVDTPAGLQASVSRAAEEMTGHGWIHDGPALPLLSEFGGADPNAWVPLTIRFFAETTDDGIAEEEKQQQSTVLGSQPSESDAASITFLNTNQLDIIMLYAQLDDAETALALNSRLVSAGSTLLGTIASPITVHNTDGSATGLEVSERWPVVGLRYWNDHVRMERLDLAPEYGIIDMEVARKAFQHLVA